MRNVLTRGYGFDDIVRATGLPREVRLVDGLIPVAFGTLREVPFASCFRSVLLGFLSKANPFVTGAPAAFDVAARSVRFKNGLGRSSSSSGAHRAGALAVRCIPPTCGGKTLALTASACNWETRSSAEGEGFQVGRVLILVEERRFCFGCGVFS